MGFTMLKIFEFELPTNATGHFELAIPEGSKFLSLRSGIIVVDDGDGIDRFERAGNCIAFLADAKAKLRLYDFWAFKAGELISEEILNPFLRTKPTYLGVWNGIHYWWRDGVYWGDDDG